MAVGVTFVVEHCWDQNRHKYLDHYQYFQVAAVVVVVLPAAAAVVVFVVVFEEV